MVFPQYFRINDTSGAESMLCMRVIVVNGSQYLVADHLKDALPTLKCDLNIQFPPVALLEIYNLSHEK